MQLANFIEVPPAATGAGAAIQAAIVNSFRQNDQFFEKIMQAVLACPFVPNGVDGELPAADLLPQRFVQATKIALNNPVAVVQKVPMIWFAREKIVINALVNANGKGAIAGESGDFGGSGGGQGGGAAGGSCLVPVTGQEMMAGGVAGAPGQPVGRDWASRALSFAAFCKGGAGGGGPNGGAGGGVVFLCAPEIEFTGTGKIEANGLPGTAANAGGGGGGLIVLIARRFSSNISDLPGSTTLAATGGGGNGTGGGGGNGVILKLTVN